MELKAEKRLKSMEQVKGEGMKNLIRGNPQFVG